MPFSFNSVMQLLKLPSTKIEAVFFPNNVFFGIKRAFISVC